MDKPRTCTVEGCGAKHYAKGLCVNHYYRLRERGDLRTRKERGELEAQQQCTMDGCAELRIANGLCKRHYEKLRKSGTLERLVYGPEWRKNHSHPYRNSLGHIDPTPDTRPGHRGYLAVNVVNDIKQKAVVRTRLGSRITRRKPDGWWALTAEQAYRLIVAECFYCCVASGWPSTHNGIDRMDSSLGYTVENCVSACWRCNRAKGDGSVDEFLVWARRLRDRFCGSAI